MPRIPRLGRRDAFKIRGRTDAPTPTEASASPAPDEGVASAAPVAPAAATPSLAVAPAAPPSPADAGAQATEAFTAVAGQPTTALPDADDPAADGPPAAQEPPGARGRGFGERGRLRRRLRFLRRARELAFRDLGGLVFDLSRFGRQREDLVTAKLATLSSIDAELRALEVALDDRQPTTVLREAGIAACPRCAAIHGSDARFCPTCGLPMRRSAERPMAVAGAGDVPGESVAGATAPAVPDAGATAAPAGTPAAAAPSTPPPAPNHVVPPAPEQPTGVLPVPGPGIQSGNGDTSEADAHVSHGSRSSLDPAGARRASEADPSSG